MKDNSIFIEYNEIKRIYDNIINNYSELSLMFNLKNPIEIYLMYLLSLYNGYLSKTDNFTYYDNESLFINCKCLKGADVLNGYGVCRHISAMLKDIYDKMNINNEILPIYLNEEKTKKRIITSNHVINIVSDKNKSYLLDPTNSYVWYKVGKKCLIHINKEDISIASITNQFDILSYSDYNINKLKNIKCMLSKTSDLTKEDILLLEHTASIFNNNLVIFKQFKNENIKYYFEVTERLTDLKSKILRK